MSEGKHTSDKWRLTANNECGWIIEAGYKVICQRGPMSDADENRANARLIAAAPELLEALKRWLHRHHPHRVGRGRAAMKRPKPKCKRCDGTGEICRYACTGNNCLGAYSISCGVRRCPDCKQKEDETP